MHNNTSNNMWSVDRVKNDSYVKRNAFCLVNVTTQKWLNKSYKILCVGYVRICAAEVHTYEIHSDSISHNRSLRAHTSRKAKPVIALKTQKYYCLEENRFCNHATKMDNAHSTKMSFIHTHTHTMNEIMVEMLEESARDSNEIEHKHEQEMKTNTHR